LPRLDNNNAVIDNVKTGDAFIGIDAEDVTASARLLENCMDLLTINDGGTIDNIVIDADGNKHIGGNKTAVTCYLVQLVIANGDVDGDGDVDDEDIQKYRNEIEQSIGKGLFAEGLEKDDSISVAAIVIANAHPNFLPVDMDGEFMNDMTNEETTPTGSSGENPSGQPVSQPVLAPVSQPSFTPVSQPSMNPVVAPVGKPIGSPGSTEGNGGNIDIPKIPTSTNTSSPGITPSAEPTSPPVPSSPSDESSSSLSLVYSPSAMAVANTIGFLVVWLAVIHQ